MNVIHTASYNITNGIVSESPGTWVIFYGDWEIHRVLPAHLGISIPLNTRLCKSEPKHGEAKQSLLLTMLDYGTSRGRRILMFIRNYFAWLSIGA